ncbi:MAG: amino acid ABC transporter permease [Dehalococcoidales bacterium]|nr:amino acid ABC transporter permease [Dehalococcoidales bacterium]
MTIFVSLASIAIAFFLGLFSCLFGISRVKPLQLISKFYVWIMRGTPFIVQLFIIKYGVPQLGQLVYPEFKVGIVAAAIATLSLNAGAYMSEIFRGAIQAVDPGQMEAARSLGLSRTRAMIKVILPQALKISIPTLANQFIITIKDSSLAQVIGLPEMFQQATIYVGTTFQSFASYVFVGVWYLVIITILSFFIKRIERKQQREQANSTNQKTA